MQCSLYSFSRSFLECIFLAMAWPQKEEILIFVTFIRNPIGDGIGSDFDSIQVT